MQLSAGSGDLNFLRWGDFPPAGAWLIAFRPFSMGALIERQMVLAIGLDPPETVQPCNGERFDSERHPPHSRHSDHTGIAILVRSPVESVSIRISVAC